MPCAPYREGPEARKIGKLEIEKALEKKIPEPAETEWSVQFLIAPEKKGSFRFFVGYQIVIEMTVRDS